MKTTLYEYSSYRTYLNDRLTSKGPRSGQKRKASEALQVHTTFISQVTLGRADLSLDQAERMNNFLGHSEDEGQYFLDLVIHDRASDPLLKNRFRKKIQAHQNERSQLKKHLQSSQELRPEDQNRFYSSHIYGLLHVLSSIPKFSTRKNLIEATGLSPVLANECIDFLLKLKVLKTSDDRIVPGEKHIHLGKDSNNIWRHHSNWRMATLQNFSFNEPTDLHYSGAMSCSLEDAIKIRELLLKQLKTINTTVSASKEETAYIYCFDFFKWA
jgi:uncharacterized protein (TIGR02147 family)